jgi:hypothetical protein
MEHHNPTLLLYLSSVQVNVDGDFPDKLNFPQLLSGFFLKTSPS